MSSRFTTRHTQIILSLGLASLLASCATSDPAVLRRIELTKGVNADAKSCCASLATLLDRAQPLTMASTSFTPETDHFDVGFGLAPVQVYRLDPSSKAVEVHAPLQLLGFAYGGDGKARHLDAKIQFLDSTGKWLQTTEPHKVVRYLGSGYRALFYYSNIPAGAEYVSFTTDPKRNGASERSPMEGMPATGFMAGAVPILLPAPGSSSYTLTNYSPLQFQALGEAIKLKSSSK